VEGGGCREGVGKEEKQKIIKIRSGMLSSPEETAWRKVEKERTKKRSVHSSDGFVTVTMTGFERDRVPTIRLSGHAPPPPPAGWVWWVLGK